MPNMTNNKVVITGMGIVSVLGSSLSEYWGNLIEGKSGIGKITQFDASKFPSQIAGEVIDFNPLDHFSRKDARRMPRSSQMALAASISAVNDSGLGDHMPVPERASIVFGTAMGGLDFLDAVQDTLRNVGLRQLSPFIAGGSIPNNSAFLIGREFQCQGPNSTITTACASSTQAIGEGSELIRRGAADIVIVGGTEAFISDFGIGGFSSMRVLATSFNDDPSHASRPFDMKREGFVLSEGAAVLILESEKHAVKRRAKIYAELAGHASSSDAYHLSSPDPNSHGQIRAMNWAIEDANLDSSDIDYINAHGTSTPVNDANETRAIKSVFGDHAYKLSISSTKSMLGHAMGASGALEAIASIMAIEFNTVPPTINYENPDPDLDLDYTPNKPISKELNVALSNSFGLGGQNSCLILKKYNNNSQLNENNHE